VTTDWFPLFKLQFLDSTSASDIAVGFSRYLEMIWHIPGQKYDKGFFLQKRIQMAVFLFAYCRVARFSLSITIDGKNLGFFRISSDLLYSGIPYGTHPDMIFDAINVREYY
jgi:hypothetical protein